MPLAVLTPRKTAYTTKRPACMHMKRSPEGVSSRCRVRASWRLYLRLVDKGGVVKTMSTPLKVCNRCRTLLEPADVLDPRTWLQVKKQMLLKCGFKPQKNRTALYYARQELEVEELN